MSTKFIISIISIFFVHLFILRPVSFAENKSKETILHENIIELMDSLQSSSFDSLFLNLKTEVINANSDELYIELLKLKVYEYYLNGNTDSLYFYTEILKNKAMYVSDMESYYKAWGYTINHYSLTGRIYKAISESENMLAEASALHNIYGMALSRQYLGEIYLYMELYDESISQLRKSFDYAQKAGFSPKEISSICFSLNLALIYKNDYRSVNQVCCYLDSLNSVNDTIEYNLVNKAYKVISDCCRTIACSRTRNFEEAEIYLKRATAMFVECNMQQDFLLEANAIYNYEKGNYKKSLQYYEELHSFYKKIGLQKESLRILNNIIDVNGKMGDYCEVYNNFELYKSLKDSLSIDVAYQHLNELAVSNDLKNIELEKKNLQLDIQKARAKYLMIFAAFIVFIAMIITYYYIRERKLNIKLLRSENSLREEKLSLARSEEMLLAALERAKQSEIIKTSFISNISHEIRTPLNSIVGFSDMIISCDEEEIREEYGKVIRNNNDLLLKLINDILEVSVNEAEKTSRNITEFDITTIFKEQYEANKRKVKDGVEFKYEANFNKMIVKMDKMRITQIIINFLSNAIKFTSKGHIQFGFQPYPQGLKIYVSDTGIGIKEQDQEKIFEKFYKVNDFSQGTGLGISLCKALIEECEGEIGVESEFGVGSTFFVCVPCEIIDCEMIDKRSIINTVY